MHRDPQTRYPWHLALLEGRSKRSARIEATKIRNAKNRVNGLGYHRERESERDPDYAAKAQKVLDHPHLSERAVARLSKLSRRQVRVVRGKAA
jgi:hypothetical protein